MNEEQVLQVLRDEVANEGSAAAWATKNRISVPFIYAVLSGRRKPSPAMLAAMGLKRETVFTPLAKSGKGANGA